MTRRDEGRGDGLVAAAEQHLRAVATLVRHHGRAILERFDITPPQFDALLVLMRHPDLTMGELCQHLYLASSTVTDLVDRLERQQLVQRVRDPDDRRVIRLRLLPRARELMDAVLEARRAYLARVLAHLEPADRQGLLRSLERLVEAMRREGGGPPAATGPAVGAGVAMITAADEAVSLHQRVAESAWRDALKGGVAASRLRALLHDASPTEAAA